MNEKAEKLGRLIKVSDRLKNTLKIQNEKKGEKEVTEISIGFKYSHAFLGFHRK